MKSILRKTIYILPLVLIILLTVFITASASSATLKKPALYAPVSTTAGVKVSWGKVSGAQKYRVFVKTGSSSWVKLADTTATAYYHKAAKSGTTYTYTVRCISRDGKRFMSDYNRSGRKVTYVQTPKVSSFLNTARGPVIYWNTCKGASKYRVYINTSKGWKTLATVKNASYLHTDAKNGVTYSYKIRCLNKNNQAVSAFGAVVKNTYRFNATDGVYTNVMFAADIYGTLRKEIKVPAKPNVALNRKTAASILCTALGYKSRASLVSLNDTTDAAMKTVTFYGYFYPTENNLIYPAKIVTGEEYSAILSQVQRYKLLRGKRALSFGDSIMYGTGNNAYGDGRMLSEKYGMSYTCYAYSGATFSTTSNGRKHIVDNIRAAASAGCKADVIFLNGATNDIKMIAAKTTTDTFDPSAPEKSQYAQGFKLAINLINSYWKGVPVMYVRAHNISSCPNELEIPMGEYGLSIAASHGAYTVDVFDDTDFNTSYAAMRDRYTYYRAEINQCDGTHPNYLGYTTYYLPLESKTLSKIFGNALIEG